MRTIIGKADAASLRCRENINRVVKDMHEVVGDHSFSTFANVLKNCHLLPPDTHACVRIRGLEMLVFRKILHTY